MTRNRYLVSAAKILIGASLDEVRTFFIVSKLELADRLCDFDWLCKLAYLAEIFSHLNGLNLALQGTAVTMFHVQNKIEATIKKRIARANYESFENVSDFLSKEERTLPVTAAVAMTEHMQALKSQQTAELDTVSLCQPH